jgi:D-beta-D-heptose 7-phosphate kinase/D-beta-D-heptose 1-phosphate adenosyltransferase
MKNEDIVLITGGFDPIHSGHIEYIKAASEIGRVIIGLNSDEWLTRKKGIPFQSFEERFAILSNLKNVLCVIDFDDSDGSAIDAIKKTQKLFPKSQIVFANGGDRTTENLPELSYCTQNNIQMIFGVGGETKKNSSSWILSNWVNQNKENRFWGSFKTLYTAGHNIKVKELILDSGKSISLQKHQHRNEFWVIISGTAKVQKGDTESILQQQDYVHIKQNTLHKLTNIGSDVLKVLEVQYGTVCDESDIERF